VSRRLDIELTSRRDDDTWTWRAAGARQPKGEVRAELLPASAAVGSVLKAEAEVGLDGLEIILVMEPKVRPEPTDRLTLIQTSSAPAVTTKLAPKTRRRSRKDRGFDDEDDSFDADDDRRQAKRQGKKRRRQADADDTSGDRDSTKRRNRDRRDQRDRRKPRRESIASGRAEGGGRSSKNTGERRNHHDKHRSERSTRPARPRGPSLKPKRVHRQAALKALPTEQQPLAREVLNGGVPRVRNSIERMNAKAVDAKLPQIKAEPLLALAEQLAPVLKAAEWRDRAEAALAGIATVDLREIRSVIAAADRAARTDETRALAASLNDGFADRLEADQRQWLDELAATISDGRTIRALRLSSWPPKAGTPLPVDMAERLTALAASDLNDETNQQRWATVMDAVSLSPVRAKVIPAGIPAKPGEELLASVRRLAPRVPQIAKLFGVTTQTPDKPSAKPEAATELPDQTKVAGQTELPDETEAAAAPPLTQIVSEAASDAR